MLFGGSNLIKNGSIFNNFIIVALRKSKVFASWALAELKEGQSSLNIEYRSLIEFNYFNRRPKSKRCSRPGK
jgi:hypothetical protein